MSWQSLSGESKVPQVVTFNQIHPEPPPFVNFLTFAPEGRWATARRGRSLTFAWSHTISGRGRAVLELTQRRCPGTRTPRRMKGT